MDAPSPFSGRSFRPTGQCTLTLLALASIVGGCKSSEPDVAAIYRHASEASSDTRRPVILIPGILGSKLVDSRDRKVWGAFTRGAIDADNPDGARTFALPMREGAPLSALKDDVIADSVLDVIVADIGPFSGFDFAAYLGVLQLLDIGGFRDQALGESGAMDYGTDHYTCYQFPYDWRRDVSESAAELGRFIAQAQDTVRSARGLADGTPVKIDVVAHSMGGLVLRYYLRYGSQPLPDDGSLPELTWEGAEHVCNAILVATPSAGSVKSLAQLVEGLNLHPLFPNYRPSVLGTMPAIYQLLPRPRHGLIAGEDGRVIDHFDPAIWRENGWGLAAQDSDKALDWLLDDVPAADRPRVAQEHLAKCLARAKQLHRALDAEASPPEGTRLFLFAGDAEPTQARYQVSDDGELRCIEHVPGDGTVTRASALMDERLGRPYTAGLQSPVDWHRVQFIFENHVGLTSSRAFADNVLHILLEEAGADPSTAQAPAAQHASVRPVHWGYAGSSGPAAWATLCEDYAQCGAGLHQSPINISSNDVDAVRLWEVEYQPTSLNVAHHQHVAQLTDNGHTIQATCDPGSWLIAGGERFELKQFHFHTPSEHSIDDEHFPMEMHFVHQSETGHLMVLGVLVSAGEHNPAFDPLIALLPGAPGESTVDAAYEIDIAALLPASRDSFEYQGSLTTPPCSEGVKWLISVEHIELSTGQLLEFARRLGTNNRPVQGLNGRHVGSTQPGN